MVGIKILIIMVSVFLSACRADRNTEIRRVDGWEYGSDRNTLLFVTPENGFAGGGRSTTRFDSQGNRDTSTFVAIIWKTQDGGHHWDRMLLNEFSSINQLVAKDNSIYATARADDGRSTSAILKSSDMGESWRVIHQGQERIKAMYVRDSLHIYFFGDQFLNATSDGGKTWHAYDNPHGESIFGVFYDDATAYYFKTDPETFEVLCLVGLNLDSGEYKMIALPPGRKMWDMSKGNLFTMYNGKVVELYRIEDGSASLISSFDPGKYDYFPHFIDSYGDKIYLYLKVSGGGFFGSHEKLLFSPDAGRSWNRIRLGLYEIYPFYDCISTLPVGDNFVLYYVSSPESLGVITE